MNTCRKCGAPTAEHCTRWDCPELRWHPFETWPLEPKLEGWMPLIVTPQQYEDFKDAGVPEERMRIDRPLSTAAPDSSLKFQCYQRIVEGVRMNSPLDWDYADLKRRMDNLRPPPYKSGSGVVGNHCDHCPTDPSKHCLVSCSQAYRNRYGVEPQ